MIDVIVGWAWILSITAAAVLIWLIRRSIYDAAIMWSVAFGLQFFLAFAVVGALGALGVARHDAMMPALLFSIPAFWWLSATKA